MNGLSMCTYIWYVLCICFGTDQIYVTNNKNDLFFLLLCDSLLQFLLLLLVLFIFWKHTDEHTAPDSDVDGIKCRAENVLTVIPFTDGKMCCVMDSSLFIYFFLYRERTLTYWYCYTSNTDFFLLVLKTIGKN